MGTEEGARKRLDTTGMRMLRWPCGVTKFDKIRNERIRETTKGTAGNIIKKEGSIEKIPASYSHVMRRDEEHVGS